MNFPTSFGILGTAVLCSSIASAQVSPEQTSTMEHIVVTAARQQQLESSVLATTTVIDREQITLWQPESVVDLLSTVAGVDLSRQGGAGQETSLFVRGTNSNHTLILVDGVRVGSATLGQTSLSAINVEQIDRIEIVRGPRAALYGSDALGAVIQIFTRQLNAGEVNLAAAAGSDHYASGKAAIGIGNEAFNTTLSVSRVRSSGYDVKRDLETDDDGYQRNSVSLKGDARIAEIWQLNWVGNLDDGDYDYDNTSASWQGENHADYRNYFWRVGGGIEQGAVSSMLYLGQSRDKDEQSGNGVAPGQGSRFETRRDQVSWLNRWDIDQHFTLSGGWDYYREQVEAESAWGPTDYTQTSRRANALFAHLQYDYAGWLAEAALRRDKITGLSGETTANVGIGYQFDKGPRVAVNAGTGFKAPSFNDLYYPGSGNPELNSEQSKSIELSLKLPLGRWGKAEANLYENRIDDLIQWMPVDPNDPWSPWLPENVAKAKIVGLEVIYAVRTGPVAHQLNLSHVDPRDRDTDQRLIRRAYFTGSWAATLDWQAWQAGIQYQYHGSRRSASYALLESYQLANLSLGYQLSSDWAVRGRVSNLFDEQYQTADAFNPPGRQYQLQLEYRGMLF